MITHLKDGQPAPAFDLPDQDGARHRLADFRGQHLLLFFYGEDDTPS
jgi:thioredoxin-dependent peroxiredoxin